MIRQEKIKRIRMKGLVVIKSCKPGLIAQIYNQDATNGRNDYDKGL